MNTIIIRCKDALSASIFIRAFERRGLKCSTGQDAYGMYVKTIKGDE